MTDLPSLIERLEQATGPSDELDCRICFAVFPDQLIMVDGGSVGPNRRPAEYIAAKDFPLDNWTDWKSLRLHFEDGKPFTHSLDAARTMLRKGTLWVVGDMEDGPFARLVIPQPDGGYVGGYVEAKAKTTELALCIAALRARDA